MTYSSFRTSVGMFFWLIGWGFLYFFYFAVITEGFPIMPEGGLLKLSEASYKIHGRFMRPLRLLVASKNIFRRVRLGRGHRFPHEKWVHTLKLRWGHLSLWPLEMQVSLGRKKSDLQKRPWRKLIWYQRHQGLFLVTPAVWVPVWVSG